jgi:hypothetical protein
MILMCDSKEKIMSGVGKNHHKLMMMGMMEDPR